MPDEVVSSKAPAPKAKTPLQNARIRLGHKARDVLRATPESLRPALAQSGRYARTHFRDAIVKAKAAVRLVKKVQSLPQQVRMQFEAAHTPSDQPMKMPSVVHSTGSYNVPWINSPDVYLSLVSLGFLTIDMLIGYLTWFN